MRAIQKGNAVGHIIVGVDGSDHSVHALTWAATEARLRGVTLRAVTTFSVGFLSTGYEIALPDRGDLKAATQTMLDAALDTVRETGGLDGVDVESVVLEGHAGERLIALSDGAEMVIVGSRGRGGFVGALMGSVTTYVVNHASCPVVVVR